MKNKINPRMDKMLSYQINMILINSIASLIIAGYLVFFESDQFSVSPFSVAGAAVLAFVISKVLNFLSAAFIQHMIYRGDTDALQQDAENAAEVLRSETEMEEVDEESTSTIKNNVAIKIVNLPEKTIGTFLDCDIYEWIDLHPHGDDSQIFRAYFEGTINLEKTKEYSIPEGCILLPPGLFYKLSSVQ